MSHFLREHKKPILWVVIIIVVFTFGVLGAFSHLFRKGKSGDAVTENTVLAQIGAETVQVQDLRRQMSAILDSRIKQGQKNATYNDLMFDGTALRTLENLISGALFRNESRMQSFNLDQEYLINRLKKQFTDENGQFNPNAWNNFIDRVEKDSTRNWTTIYAEMRNSVNLAVHSQEVIAPARVLDADISEEFETGYTKISVKYFEVAPEIKPTDDQIQAEYDKDPKKFQQPEQRVAEYVAVSLKPPRPDVLDTIVKRARDGEDFAELVKEYSDAPATQKEKGGDIGWVKETEFTPEYRKPIFKLAVGEVTDPIEYVERQAYYVFKVDEERTTEDTSERELKVRELMVRPTLSEEEKASRKEEADAIAANAKETGDLKLAAEEAGLELKTSGKFSMESNEIEGLDRRDFYAFKNKMLEIATDEISDVFDTAINHFIARIVETEDPVIRPLDEVRDKVEQETTRTIQNSSEHKVKVAKYITDISEKAKSIEDVKSLFPELKINVQESQPFSIREFDYRSGLYWRPNEVYQAVGFGEPGTFGGPINDLFQKIYFVELVSKTDPDEKVWEEKWPEEEKTIRQNMQMAMRNLFMNDYLKDLRDRKSTGVISNNTAISEVLGIPEITTALENKKAAAQKN